MEPKTILQNAIDPAHRLLKTFDILSDQRARLWSLTIAGQESHWKHRRQVGGPARSYWQGELTGGMILVLRHPATKRAAEGLVKTLDVGEPNLSTFVFPTDRTVYEAIAWHDVLAAGLARLLLFSDAAALPNMDDVAGGWTYYKRVWGPGAPHPETWPDRHRVALELVNTIAPAS